jgi:AdoMet-dependent heme synthase
LKWLESRRSTCVAGWLAAGMASSGTAAGTLPGWKLGFIPTALRGQRQKDGVRGRMNNVTRDGFSVRAVANLEQALGPVRGMIHSPHRKTGPWWHCLMPQAEFFGATSVPWATRAGARKQPPVPPGGGGERLSDCPTRGEMANSHQIVRDYAQTPLNVYWEMTQACALACRHCRAEARPQASPDQLTFGEGVDLLHQILEFGEPLPHLILTGGDPLERPDLFQLIDEARRLGIGLSITPAATAKLTRELLVRLREHGVEGLGLSLDASTAARHDGLRGVPGTFDRTRQALAWAQEIGLPVQVNTLVAAETVDDLASIYHLLIPYDISRWSLFFLISVGRGKLLQPLSPIEAEELMRWIYRTGKQSPFVIATTEAPSYRRIVIEEMRGEGLTGEQIKSSPASRGFRIRDGHGVMFVSQAGDVCPAGFLPLPAGNVRRDRMAGLYRHHELFRAMHDPGQFHGRCGECEFHLLCGGSRARAYAAMGDPLGSDPLCSRVSEQL